MALLEVSHLKKIYTTRLGGAKIQALKDVSFSVEAGMALLAGVEEDNVAAAGERLLTDAALYHQMSHAINPYGDGHTSQRIGQLILDWRRERRARA